MTSRRLFEGKKMGIERFLMLHVYASHVMKSPTHAIRNTCRWWCEFFFLSQTHYRTSTLHALCTRRYAINHLFRRSLISPFHSKCHVWSMLHVSGTASNVTGQNDGVARRIELTRDSLLCKLWVSRERAVEIIKNSALLRLCL